MMDCIHLLLFMQLLLCRVQFLFDLGGKGREREREGESNKSLEEIFVENLYIPSLQSL